MNTLLRCIIFTVCMVAGSKIIYLAIEQLNGNQISLEAVTSDILIAFVVLLIGVITLASLLSDTMADLITKIFGQTRYAQMETSSLYSTAESLEKSGDIETAIDAYKAIALKDSKNATPYIRMIKLAFVTLKDPDRAHSLYVRGSSLISTKVQQRRLEKSYTYYKRTYQ